MIVKKLKTKSALETGAEMARLIKAFAGDVSHLVSMSFKDFFNYVSTLKYYRDPKFIELIQRPKHSLNNTNFRDCDDKTILISAWAYLRKIPIRLIAVGKTRLSHVYPALYVNGSWLHADATYLRNDPGVIRKWQLAKIIGRL